MHPGGSSKGKIWKKWKILIFLKCPKLSLILSKHFPNLFWSNFSSKKSRQCNLEGRGLEKTLKKKKNFEVFKIVRKISQKHCMRMFWLIFSTENAVPSEPWRLKKNPQKSKNSKFQNPEKRFKKCPNLLEVIFSIFSCPVHPGASKLGKTSKNWKNFHLFKMPEKTFPKAIKHVFNMPRGNFFGKNFCPVHPGWSKLAKNTKKWKNCETFKFLQKHSQKQCLGMFCLIISTEKSSAQCTLETRKSSTGIEMNSNFQKCPKTFPRVSKHVLMWFFRYFLASAPWRLETSKNFKEMQKLPKIQDTQTRFQKCPNKFWTCFEVFSRKKCPVHTGGSKLGKI